MADLGMDSLAFGFTEAGISFSKNSPGGILNTLATSGPNTAAAIINSWAYTVLNLYEINLSLVSGTHYDGSKWS